MLTFISIILIVICLIVILAIILKKFPALAILDISNLPGVKEAKFKDQIIKQRVERDLAKWGGKWARFWLYFQKKISVFLQKTQKQLKKVQLNYRVNAKIPWPEKQKKIKELFLAVDDLFKKEMFSEAEEKLIEIVSLDQKNLTAFFKLGELYDLGKKYSEARQTYNYSLKLAKQYQDEKEIMGDITIQEIYFSLAYLEKEADNLEIALEYIREALDLEPNNPRYLDLILDLSIIKKDKKQAEEYLEKMALVNPENNKLTELKEKIELL